MLSVETKDHFHNMLQKLYMVCGLAKMVIILWLQQALIRLLVGLKFVSIVVVKSELESETTIEHRLQELL